MNILAYLISRSKIFGFSSPLSGLLEKKKEKYLRIEEKKAKRLDGKSK